MKIAQKLIMVAATCLSICSAMAASPSTGTLDFSGNVLLDQRLLRVATPPNTAGTGNVVPANSAAYDTVTKVVNLTFNAASTPTGAQAFTASDSLIRLGQLWYNEDNNGDPLPPIASYVFLKNLTIDLGAAEVQADISTFSQNRSGDISTADHGRAVVFAIDVTGQYTGTPGNLRLTTSATDMVLQGLYGWYGEVGPPLDSSQQIYQIGATMNWGLLHVSSAVPEPSTWALMLMGTLPILTLRRIRAA
jgi:hypothetical protein